MKKIISVFSVRKIMSMALALVITLSTLYIVNFIAKASPNTVGLVNPGFEDGLNGYEYGETITATVVTDADKNSNVLKLESNAAKPYGSQLFWQEVDVEAGKTYVWKFSAKATNTNNSFVGVRSADGATLLASSITCTNNACIDTTKLQFTEERDASQVGANWHPGMRTAAKAADTQVTTWQDYTVTFDSGEHTTVSLSFNLWAGDRIFFVDDMTLTQFIDEEITEFSNGDFEDGFSGYSYDKTVASIATGSGNVYSGEKAAKLTATNKGQSISKAVFTEKNKKYVWRFWAKLPSNKEYQVSVTETTQNPLAVEADVKTTVGNSKIRIDDGKSYIVGTGDWNEYTATLLSGENESLKLILSSTGADTIFTDNWSFVAYAEPGVLVNSSFEEELNGYIVSEVEGFTAEVVTDTVKNGTKALHLKTTGSDIGNAMIWQHVAVEANTEYKWKFWAKSDSGATKNTLVGVRTADGTKLVKSSITCNDISDFLDPGLTSFDSVRSTSTWSNWHQGIRSKSGSKGWVEYTVTFETGDITNVLLTVNAFAKDREIWLDNMSLEALQKTEIIPNSGFENGTEGYYTEGLIISADIENKYYGDYSLKMTGSGILKKPVEIDAYTDYEWTFYFKTATAGAGYFAVCSEDGNTLLASDIDVSYGTGTVENISFANDRAAGQKSNYHKVISDGTWSKYTVKFNSGKQNKVILTYLGDGIEAYTDEWSLNGDFVYPEEQLLNAGFEDGKFNAYNHDSNVTAEITTENTKSGKFAAVLTKDETRGGNAHLYQTVKVKPNSDYIWTFWVKFENSATPVGADAVNSNNAYLLSRIGGDHNSTSESGFDWHRIRYSDGEWHKYQISLSTGNADMIKLRLYMYTASSKIVTDDWSLDYVGETKSSNAIFNVGFENENAIHTTDSSSWAVTDAEAHSGSKSAIYDGSKAMAGSQLLYNDEYGIERKIATLEKNTNYRFSFYYKGTGKLERAFLRLEFQNRNYENLLKNTIGCDDEEWNYFEMVFNTENSAGALFKISSVFVGYRGTLLYVDDIKLEKIVPGITDHTSDPDSIECSEEENLIPDSLDKEIILDDTTDDIYELKLTPYGLYNFAFDYYGENDPNAQIGLSFAEDGTVFTADKIYATSVSSIVNINENSSEFLRSGYSFCAPESGVVYLIMKNNSGTVKIKNLTLYSILPKSVDFKEIPTSSNGSTNSHASIWDQEYDFDFDWNNGDNNFEDTIIESEDNIEENKPSGKRMLRVKKRVLISKGKPGINVWLIVAICAAAVIVAFGTVFAILFIRKKKKKNKI